MGIALGVILVSFASALAPAASASHNTQFIRVSEGFNTQETNPSIAFGPDGEVYAAYLRYDTITLERDILVRSDTDGWVSDGTPLFTNVRVANDNAGTADSSFFSNVPMVVARTGEVYVAWTDDRDFATRGTDIRVARSDDQANSFLPSTVVTDFLAMNSETYPAMAIGPSGTVYLVWQDTRGGVADIFFSRSSDGGVTWSPNVQINDVSGASQQWYARIAVDSLERVFVVWSDMIIVNNAVRFDLSLDGGQTWGADVEIGSGQGSNLIPDIVVGRFDILHVAWQSTRANDRGVYYARSVDHGASWLPEGRVSDIPGFGDPIPRIATAPGGYVTILWLTGFMPGELGYAVYYNDGASHSYRTGITAGVYRYAVAGDANGNVFFVWTRDDGASSYEVYATWLDNAPVTPSGFRGTPSGGTVSLFWNRNPENDVAGYTIYRASPTGDYVYVATVPASATSFTNAALSGGVWTYTLYTFDREGHTSFPAIATVEVGITTDDRLDTLQGEIDVLKGNLSNLEGQNAELGTQLAEAGNEIGALRNQVGGMQNLVLILLIVVIALLLLSILLGRKGRRTGWEAAYQPTTLQAPPPGPPAPPPAP